MEAPQQENRKFGMFHCGHHKDPHEHHEHHGHHGHDGHHGHHWHFGHHWNHPGNHHHHHRSPPFGCHRHHHGPPKCHQYFGPPLIKSYGFSNYYYHAMKD